MLMNEEAHGGGTTPDFPTSQQIKEAMEGHEETHMVPIYGDGSQTTPTNWWAALGGYGAWIPKWMSVMKAKQKDVKRDIMGPTIRQTGSPTRF